MPIKHRRFIRIVHRIIEELDATKKIAKTLSWKDALFTLKTKFDIQMINKNGYYESSKATENLMKKHSIMLRYYESIFVDYWKNYNYNADNDGLNYSNYIWVCWWQGLEEAPLIVKKCIDSIKKNAGSHEVIVLTEDNYKDYVTIPKWIEDKKEKGIISRTHFSDILRLELLAKYGGIWLDSTFYCNNVQIDEYFNQKVWSIKRPDYGHVSVACGQFANYSFGCSFEYRNIFGIIRDLLFEYWKINNSITDYLFLDYLIIIAQRHCPEVANIFNTISPNNPMCDELYKILNEEYDEEKWRSLTKNTSLFKLTWKQEFLLEKNGRPTFYKKIILDELE